VGVIFGVAVTSGVGVGVGTGVGEGVRVGDGVGAGVRVGVGDGVGVGLVALLPHPTASVPSNIRTSASVAISLIQYPPLAETQYINYSCFDSGFQ